MSEHVIQQALKIFEDQEKRRLPPSLAVLGPPGSGKSLFLGRLLSVLRNDAACAEKPSLMINLENIRVGSQADTYVYLNQELLKEATAIGISVDFDIRTQPSHLRFEEILRHLLKAVEGYLIIFIDHLERVPRVFASDLSHRFRNFLESTESDSDYRRLGLVIAGAVSLFELKQSPDSAFQMLPVISFPPLGPDTRKDFVEDI
jgi:DNA polymerase III delta prime subunit